MFIKLTNSKSAKYILYNPNINIFFIYFSLFSIGIVYSSNKKYQIIQHLKNIYYMHIIKTSMSNGNK